MRSRQKGKDARVRRPRLTAWPGGSAGGPSGGVRHRCGGEQQEPPPGQRLRVAVPGGERRAEPPPPRGEGATRTRAQAGQRIFQQHKSNYGRFLHALGPPQQRRYWRAGGPKNVHVVGMCNSFDDTAGAWLVPRSAHAGSMDEVQRSKEMGVCEPTPCDQALQLLGLQSAGEGQQRNSRCTRWCRLVAQGFANASKGSPSALAHRSCRGCSVCTCRHLSKWAQTLPRE